MALEDHVRPEGTDHLVVNGFNIDRRKSWPALKGRTGRQLSGTVNVTATRFHDHVSRNCARMVAGEQMRKPSWGKVESAN